MIDFFFAQIPKYPLEAKMHGAVILCVLPLLIHTMYFNLTMKRLGRLLKREVEGSYKNLNSIFFHLIPAATAFAAYWPLLNNFPLTHFLRGGVLGEGEGVPMGTWGAHVSTQ